MNGLKVFFEDATNYFIDNTGEIFDISVYHEILGNHSLTIGINYATTPSSLILNGIVKEYIDNKHIIKVEWYRDNMLLITFEGNIQTTYNTNILEGKVDERVIFLLLPSI